MSANRQAMYVDNEISELKKVIVHFPDRGVSRISPKSAENLLFDDIVFYSLMHKEYQVFLRILHLFLGEENVYLTHQLITEAIDACDAVKEELIDRIIDFEELPPSFEKYFNGLSDKELARLLITGYLSEDDRILYDPIPNFMFTRDIAVTIKDHILITKAAKEARHRENLLSRFIFQYHPMFEEIKAQGKVINMNDLELFPPSKRAEAAAAEGGDIMMFDPEHLMIGCSERTSHYAFESIKNILFEKKLVENIAQVNIPNERSYMHIDTLFTRVDKDLVACYKPIVYEGDGGNVIVHRIDGSKQTYVSLKDYINAEINPDMKYVFSGGGESPFAEREQWTDSVNLVALRPGIAISYDRNLRTLRHFEKLGYRVIDADDLFRNAVADQHYVNNMEKTIITIPSAELSRARGGSHCMTCPILRA